MLRHARGVLRLAVVLVLVSSPQVLAQTHGDVKPSVIQGRLVVDELNSVPVAVATSYKIFEGNLGDLYGGPLKTNDPGFVATSGTFQPGEQLWYQATGTLSFWNGTSWGTAPDNVSSKLADALGSDTLITAAGVTNPLGVIDAADSSGGIHRHLDFSISGQILQVPILPRSSSLRVMPQETYPLAIRSTSSSIRGSTPPLSKHRSPHSLFLNLKPMRCFWQA
jgi:hypothetical protein